MNDIDRAKLIREAHNLLDKIEGQISFIAETLKKEQRQAA